jgi:hypothetical protein
MLLLPGCSRGTAATVPGWWRPARSSSTCPKRSRNSTASPAPITKSAPTQWASAAPGGASSKRLPFFTSVILARRKCCGGGGGWRSIMSWSLFFTSSKRDTPRASRSRQNITSLNSADTGAFSRPAGNQGALWPPAAWPV